MPKAARDIPPPLELACLKALWSLQEGNVKDVRRIVAQSRPLAYTTIMTVLERLVRKGKLARRKVGRAFVYSPEALPRCHAPRGHSRVARGLLRRVGSGADGVHPRRRAAVRPVPARVVEPGRIDTVLL